MDKELKDESTTGLPRRARSYLTAEANKRMEELLTVKRIGWWGCSQAAPLTMPIPRWYRQ